jgi:hypothetical protein
LNHCLSWIVVGSFPFYAALSAGITPIFRRWLEQKFDRGAILCRISKWGHSSLVLQLPFPQVSESMGNHDSKIVDAASVD